MMLTTGFFSRVEEREAALAIAWQKARRATLNSTVNHMLGNQCRKLLSVMCSRMEWGPDWRAASALCVRGVHEKQSTPGACLFSSKTRFFEKQPDKPLVVSVQV